MGLFFTFFDRFLRIYTHTRDTHYTHYTRTLPYYIIIISHTHHVRLAIFNDKRVIFSDNRLTRGLFCAILDKNSPTVV